MNADFGFWIWDQNLAPISLVEKHKRGIELVDDIETLTAKAIQTWMLLNGKLNTLSAAHDPAWVVEVDRIIKK